MEVGNDVQAYFMLDEMLLAGELQEPSKKVTQLSSCCYAYMCRGVSNFGAQYRARYGAQYGTRYGQQLDAPCLTAGSCAGLRVIYTVCWAYGITLSSVCCMSL